jgi:hypothetical protein
MIALLLLLAALVVLAVASGFLGFDSRDYADWTPPHSHNR